MFLPFGFEIGFVADYDEWKTIHVFDAKMCEKDKGKEVPYDLFAKAENFFE